MVARALERNSVLTNLVMARTESTHFAKQWRFTQWTQETGLEQRVPRAWRPPSNETTHSLTFLSRVRLRYRRRVVESLDVIVGNLIQGEGATAIANALQRNSSLTSLDLWGTVCSLFYLYRTFF